MDAALSLGDLQTLRLPPFQFLIPRFESDFGGNWWSNQSAKKCPRNVIETETCARTRVAEQRVKEAEREREKEGSGMRFPLSECYKYDQLRVTYMAHGDNEKSGAVFLPHRCTTKGRPLFPITVTLPWK